MDKVREEFELAWQIKGKDDEGNLGNKPTRSKIDSDRYAGDAAQFAWVWWKRSRESVVIELPSSYNSDGDPWFAGYNCALEDVVDILKETGVNYK